VAKKRGPKGSAIPVDRQGKKRSRRHKSACLLRGKKEGG